MLRCAAADSPAPASSAPPAATPKSPQTASTPRSTGGPASQLGTPFFKCHWAATSGSFGNPRAMACRASTTSASATRASARTAPITASARPAGSARNNRHGAAPSATPSSTNPRSPATAAAAVSAFAVSRIRTLSRPVTIRREASPGRSPATYSTGCPTTSRSALRTDARTSPAGTTNHPEAASFRATSSAATTSCSAPTVIASPSASRTVPARPDTPSRPTASRPARIDFIGKRKPQAAVTGRRVRTHSRWRVWGNRSNGWTAPTVYPPARKRRKSRICVAGLQET